MAVLQHRGMRLPAVLVPSDLPLPELMAARLDGELFAVDGAHSPVDEPYGVTRRAAALSARIPARTIACRSSAAWVWGAAEELLTPLEACTPIDSRYRSGPSAGLVVHEIALTAADLARSGPLTLTSPQRTATDLALEGAGPEVLCALASIGAFALEEVLAALLERRKLPRKRAGVAALERAIAARDAGTASAQPELTR